MKIYNIALALFAGILSACNACKNDDCGGDDRLVLKVMGGERIDYSDSIELYYYDEHQQKVEAEISLRRNGPQTYTVDLQDDRAETQKRYYLQYKDQVKTVDIKSRFEKDACCGDYRRFEEIRVDGQTVSLPIEMVIA